MTHISKLTDYGMVLLSCLAREEHGTMLAAPELAARGRVPSATASKLCRRLARAGLLLSHRGVRGGYTLARSPAQITVADVIAALDGERGLRHDRASILRSDWQRVNQVVREALHRLTLADMVVPLSDERLSSLSAGGAPA